MMVATGGDDVGDVPPLPATMIITMALKELAAVCGKRMVVMVIMRARAQFFPRR